MSEEKKLFSLPIQWKNAENSSFYENVSVKTLEELAIKAGLSMGCDVKKLQSFWGNASSILEVGAGYGRVVQALLQQGYNKKLTALERCKVFCRHLSGQYADKIELIQGDLLNIVLPFHSFDVVLWLWSGIADFVPLEQEFVFSKLVTCLKPGGFLIVDTMPYNVQPLQAKPGGNQIYLTEINSTLIHTYEPTSDEIEGYALRAKVCCFQKIVFETDAKRERWLHVIRS